MSCDSDCGAVPLTISLFGGIEAWCSSSLFCGCWLAWSEVKEDMADCLEQLLLVATVYVSALDIAPDAPRWTQRQQPSFINRGLVGHS